MVLALLSVALLSAAPENAVLVQLTQQGIPAPGGNSVKLPSPSMADGLDAAAQRKVLVGVAGPGRSIDELLRDSVVAPFVLQMNEAPAGKDQRPWQRLDLWFVARGRLEQFTSDKSLNELAEGAGSGEGTKAPMVKGFVGEEDIKQRKLFQPDTDDCKRRWFYSTFDLFDRVQISATRRVVVTSTSESVVLAATVDPRFTSDPKYPNQWRPLVRDRQGRLQPTGPPQTYETAGFYAKVTQLAEPKGALFIEYHHAFFEPQQWFQGAPMLRSKIPLLVQDNVRKLRRQLRQQ